MFINLAERADELARKRLKPGEELIARAYGVRVPTLATFWLLMVFGLVLPGLVIYYLLTDVMFVLLTSRRLILISYVPNSSW